VETGGITFKTVRRNGAAVAASMNIFARGDTENAERTRASARDFPKIEGTRASDTLFGVNSNSGPNFKEGED
jgi:hypothetical protein